MFKLPARKEVGTGVAVLGVGLIVSGVLANATTLTGSRLLFGGSLLLSVSLFLGVPQTMGALLGRIPTRRKSPSAQDRHEFPTDRLEAFERWRSIESRDAAVVVGSYVSAWLAFVIIVNLSAHAFGWAFHRTDWPLVLAIAGIWPGFAARWYFELQALKRLSDEEKKRDSRPDFARARSGRVTLPVGAVLLLWSSLVFLSVRPFYPDVRKAKVDPEEALQVLDSVQFNMSLWRGRRLPISEMSDTCGNPLLNPSRSRIKETDEALARVVELTIVDLRLACTFYLGEKPASGAPSPDPNMAASLVKSFP